MLTPDTPVVLSASGKGGVGKTLFSVCLAATHAKSHHGSRLDLDIRSPNLTYVMGVPNHVAIDHEGHPIPVEANLDGGHVAVFSSGMIFGDRIGIVMDGEAMRSLVRDMIYDVAWPATDVLVVDMDPSSGDSLRAITETMRRVGALVVAASDVSSIQDCHRLLDASGQLGVRVLGVVGNMVGAECPECGRELVCRACGGTVSFGELQPVVDLAAEQKVPFLGALPWNPRYKRVPVRAVQGMGSALFRRLAKTVEDWST